MEGGDDVDAQSVGLLGDPRQAAALDLDVDSGRAVLGRPLGQTVDNGVQDGAVACVVQAGTATLGGRAAGEQERGAVNDVGHAAQALQDLGGGRGHDHRVRGG